MRTAERRMELGLIAGRLSFWQNLAAGVQAIPARFLRLVANRMSAKRLHDLDDYQLADIGLVRSDVDAALETGLLDDPTAQLAHAARLRAPKRFETIRRL